MQGVLESSHSIQEGTGTFNTWLAYACYCHTGTALRLMEEKLTSKGHEKYNRNKKTLLTWFTKCAKNKVARKGPGYFIMTWKTLSARPNEDAAILSSAFKRNHCHTSFFITQNLACRFCFDCIKWVDIYLCIPFFKLYFSSNAISYPQIYFLLAI